MAAASRVLRPMSTRNWSSCAAGCGCWRWRTRSSSALRPTSPGRTCSQNRVPAGPGARRRRCPRRGGLPVPEGLDLRLLRLGNPATITTRGRRRRVDHHNLTHSRRLSRDLWSAAGARRAAARSRRSRRTEARREVDAGGRAGRGLASPQTAGMEARHGHARGPREAAVPRGRAEPSLVLRHHPAPRAGRMGLLRRGHRRLLAQDRRVVDLGSDHRRDRRRRARDGTLAPTPRTRHGGPRGTAERNTPPGSSDIGCARPASSDRWAESPPASTTRSSRASGPPCNESSWTAPSGTRGRSSPRRCSSGSRASTTPDAGTAASGTSAPSTTKPFTPPQRSRHDQHRRTVRETGSGSSYATRASGFVAVCK